MACSTSVDEFSCFFNNVLTSLATVRTASMPAGGLRQLMIVGSWVPDLSDYRCGAPSHSVRTPVAHTTNPSAPERFEGAVLKGTVCAGRLSVCVDRVCARSLIASLDVEIGMGAIEPSH